MGIQEFNRRDGGKFIVWWNTLRSLTFSQSVWVSFRWPTYCPAGTRSRTLPVQSRTWHPEPCHRNRIHRQLEFVGEEEEEERKFRIKLNFWIFRPLTVSALSEDAAIETGRLPVSGLDGVCGA